jgi:hypothetical protein
MSDGRNKMKDVDVRTLEQTIAKAISDLIGVEFSCHIDSISFGDRSYENGAKFNVSLSQPMKFEAKNHIA